MVFIYIRSKKRCALEMLNFQNAVFCVCFPLREMSGFLNFPSSSNWLLGTLYLNGFVLNWDFLVGRSPIVPLDWSPSIYFNFIWHETTQSHGPKLRQNSRIPNHKKVNSNGFALICWFLCVDIFNKILGVFSPLNFPSLWCFGFQLTEPIFF